MRARTILLAAHQSLEGTDATDHYDILNETAHVADAFAKLLGNNSHIAIYNRESLAREYQKLGHLTIAEEAYENIYEATKNGLPEIAAWAQYERALLLAQTDLSNAKHCFKFFEEFQTKNRDQYSENDFQSEDLTYGRAVMDYWSGKYEECIETPNR